MTRAGLPIASALSGTSASAQAPADSLAWWPTRFSGATKAYEPRKTPAPISAAPAADAYGEKTVNEPILALCPQPAWTFNVTCGAITACGPTNAKGQRIAPAPMVADLAT